MTGHVCAGPFSSQDEWNWYKKNYVLTDSDDYWDSEFYDTVDDVRFWDYEGGNAYQEAELS